LLHTLLLGIKSKGRGEEMLQLLGGGGGDNRITLYVVSKLWFVNRLEAGSAGENVEQNFPLSNITLRQITKTVILVVRIPFLQ
jgi:hypothetical protein